MEVYIWFALIDHYIQQETRVALSIKLFGPLLQNHDNLFD
jgi:hypothetical protein